jgi:hypothetical protein
MQQDLTPEAILAIFCALDEEAVGSRLCLKSPFWSIC